MPTGGHPALDAVAANRGRSFRCSNP